MLVPSRRNMRMPARLHIRIHSNRNRRQHCRRAQRFASFFEQNLEFRFRLDVEKQDPAPSPSRLLLRPRDAILQRLANLFACLAHPGKHNPIASNCRFAPACPARRRKQCRTHSLTSPHVSESPDCRSISPQSKAYAAADPARDAIAPAHHQSQRGCKHTSAYRLSSATSTKSHTFAHHGFSRARGRLSFLCFFQEKCGVNVAGSTNVNFSSPALASCRSSYFQHHERSIIGQRRAVRKPIHFAEHTIDQISAAFNV